MKMKKLLKLCCTAGLFAGMVAILVAPIGTGCGGSACNAACQNNNKLACSGTCDCTACSNAPASCQDFFNCAASKSTCIDIFINCTEPAECATYVTNHCK